MSLAIKSQAAAASDRKPLGEIDFFGNKGLDLSTIRAALPVLEGDLFPPRNVKHSDDLKRTIATKVRQVSGLEPTGVSFVCCDSQGHWMVYIGLPGESYREGVFNPKPLGDVRLPATAIALSNTFGKALQKAVMSGHSAEDDSQGFALMEEPKLRAAQLAIRDYALHNEASILQVLASSSNASHRAIAAEMLGYARQSDEQIDALVRASLDEDETVRNNSIRALEVLAGAKPLLAQRIPAKPYIRLLRSGSWADHNRVSLLLLGLTKTRDPVVLDTLRNEALDSLIEMARWRSPGHAYAARMILGRIAGISDVEVNRMIEANQIDRIIDRFGAESK